MTITPTLFGSGTLFGAGTKFGYTITDDGLGTSALSDLQDILQNHGSTFTIKQETETIDTMGRTENLTETSFSAYGIMQDITKKDREIEGMGLAVAGNVKCFFKPSYGVNVIKEGNIVINRDGAEWRVVTILGERYWSDTEVFRVMVLRNIELQGS